MTFAPRNATTVLAWRALLQHPSPEYGHLQRSACFTLQARFSLAVRIPCGHTHAPLHLPVGSTAWLLRPLLAA